ncbi:MAG: hypothetical protein JRJ29_18340 [Deltaproteobacteria bacterium]|nr:hypothetical protein [Deltaproteobacteria bacterium]
MGKRNRLGVRPSLSLCIPVILLLTSISCSSSPYLKVNYRLPPPVEELKGREVILSFSDEREDKEILGKGARDKFPNFSGEILFSLSEGAEEGSLVGLYQLPSFIRAIFKKKLENAGLEVLGPEEKADTEIQIALKDFKLDLIGGKWNFKMNYEARLIRGGKVLSNLMISGRAERARVIGTGDAHRVVGESITDLVNQLDVGRLFRLAHS